nr:hypothetical protein [Methanosarcina horonobensis]
MRLSLTKPMLMRSNVQKKHGISAVFLDPKGGTELNMIGKF